VFLPISSLLPIGSKYPPQHALLKQAVTAASVKMAVFWDAALCILVEVTDASEVLAASIIRVVKPVNKRQVHDTDAKMSTSA
jgi:hypothetical protein